MHFYHQNNHRHNLEKKAPDHVNYHQHARRLAAAPNSISFFNKILIFVARRPDQVYLLFLSDDTSNE